MLPAHRSLERAVFWSLSDGKRLFLRPAGMQDRERIRAGLTHMSPRSRYLRFFAGTAELSEAQLAELTELDQIDHVAWCALDPDEDGMPGVAMARFRREAADAGVAEIAITVVDAYQHRGLGRALLALLCILARRRGVQTLRSSILEENLPIVEWLRRLGAGVRRDAGVYVVDLPVADLTDAPRDSESARRFDSTLRGMTERLRA